MARFSVKLGPTRGERYTRTFIMDSLTNKPVFEWMGSDGVEVCTAVCETMNSLGVLTLPVDPV